MGAEEGAAINEGLMASPLSRQVPIFSALGTP